MKKLFLIIFVFILVFVIYYLNLDRKVYVLSIGDNVLFNDNYKINIDNYMGNKLEDNVLFCDDGDYRIIDLLNDIKGNKKFRYGNKEYTLDNVLIKADVIFISIGMNDLTYNKVNNNYDYVDEVFRDLRKLLVLIRKYSKERIFIFNYCCLSNDDILKYINKKLSDLVFNYDIEIIDISSIKNEFLSTNEYKYIGDIIIKYLK